MGNARRRKVLFVAVLSATGVCLLLCSGLSIYQGLCQVEARVGCSWGTGEDTMNVQPGEGALFAVYQWDCLLGSLGFHACYEPAEIDVEDLPPWAEFQLLEPQSADCHMTCFVLKTQSVAEPGTYELAIRRSGSNVPPERLTLVVSALDE